MEEFIFSTIILMITRCWISKIVLIKIIYNKISQNIMVKTLLHLLIGFK